MYNHLYIDLKPDTLIDHVLHLYIYLAWVFFFWPQQEVACVPQLRRIIQAERFTELKVDDLLLKCQSVIALLSSCMAFTNLKFNTDFEAWLNRRLTAIKTDDKPVSDIRSDGLGLDEDDNDDDFGEFEKHHVELSPRQTTMSNPGSSRKSESGNYYKSVWVGDDDEGWDGSLTSLDYNHGSKTRDRVAQILRETELPEEEQTVFTIPKSHKRHNSATGSINSSTSFDERFKISKPNVTQVMPNFDSLENLESMHDFTENGYVEISKKSKFKRKSNEDYFEDDNWSFDENDRGQGDGASDITGHRSPTSPVYKGKPPPNDDVLQTVRFRKYRSDIGQLEDNYIDDDEFEPEPEDDLSIVDDEPVQLNDKQQPIGDLFFSCGIF